jgi:PAS domain S-box-containing protein
VETNQAGFSSTEEDSLKGGMVHPLITKSGETRYIEWYNKLIKENDGELLGYLYVGHDVTERLSTENLLKESENNFRHIVENALMGISIVQEGKIVYRNPEQIRLLGSAPMLFGLEGLRNIFPDDVGRVKAFYERLTSDSNAMESVDFRFYPQGNMERDVDLRWLHCVGSSFKYKGEDALYISIVDITESKQLEHMMRIEDKMASLGRVAAGLAHEIRNPLSGINIYLETLERLQSLEPSSEKTLEILAQLKRASAKIASVVQKTMDFSKPGEPRFVIVDLNQAIKEAISLSSVTLRKSDIKLEVDLDENLPRCLADLDMITQVLMNLITNAADAMESLQQEKILSIESFTNGTNVVIKIADSGPGIPRHLKEKVFEPFFSGKHDGTGIGLSLSHRIVVDHGGTLAVFDAVIGGAEFRLAIPKFSDER